MLKICILSVCSLVIFFLSVSQRLYQTVVSLSVLPDNLVTEHQWVYSIRPTTGMTCGTETTQKYCVMLYWHTVNHQVGSQSSNWIPPGQKNKDSPEQQRLIVAWSECQEIKSAVTHLFGVPTSQSQRGTYFGDTQMNPLHTVSESAVCPLSKPQFLHESQCVPVCVIITVFFLFYQKPVKPLCHGFCQMFAIVTFFNGLLPK